MSWTTWTTRLWLSTPTLKESVSSTYTSTTATGRSVKYTTILVHVLVCTWMMMHSKHPLFHLPFLPSICSSSPLLPPLHLLILPPPLPPLHLPLPPILLLIHMPFFPSTFPSSLLSALPPLHLPLISFTCRSSLPPALLSLPLPPLSPNSDTRSLFGVFLLATRKAHLFVLDRVRTNQMPNVSSLYQNERASRLAKYENYPLPPDDFSFNVRVDTESRRVGGRIIPW